MNFRIADSFTDSLAKLTPQEQKAVKTTAFDLQMDPSGPGMSFHKLDRAKDQNFWSVRVNDDIRLIVHRSKTSLLLAYVDHHDKAYAWAERRRIERHPTTGAMQMVEIRERVEEVAAPGPTAPDEGAGAPPAGPPLFADLRKGDLLAFGVPADWVEDVRAATEASLFGILEHLPQEAQEALLKLAVGETPAALAPAAEDADPFAHPDAQRRFRILTNVEELERALDYPWERWAVFLHPEQRQFVERGYGGPARISGSAGTGKTVVALHRAVHLARADGEARVLLTTFSKALANALKIRLRHLAGNEPAIFERIAVQPVTGLGHDLYSRLFGQPNIAPPALQRSLLERAATQAAEAEGGMRFPLHFLVAEWSEVVDAWQLDSWEAYRDVARLGRKTRLGARQREALWAIFEQVRGALAARKAVTWPALFGRLTAHILETGARPFDHAVVDEAQDIAVSEARFLAALAGGRPDGLFFCGDLGQRIFQMPFSWKALGIDLRGRAHCLRINYRTSHQIRAQADRLLPPSIADVDGNAEDRRGTVSVFNGPAPEIVVPGGEEEEQEAVAAWIAARLAEGCQPGEIGLIVRDTAQIARARAAARRADIPFVELSDKVETEEGSLAIATMHLAKGLEFRAVAVMACDDEVLPLQGRIESIADESDLQEVYDTERHLLYVACTRARDHLLVSGVEPASEFLEDLRV